MVVITKLPGYLVLHGKDHASTWTAQCLQKDMLVCRGSGVTVQGSPFVYESEMVARESRLSESWRATFADGRVLSDVDDLERVEGLPPPIEATR